MNQVSLLCQLRKSGERREGKPGGRQMKIQLGTVITVTVVIKASLVCTLRQGQDIALNPVLARAPAQLVDDLLYPTPSLGKRSLKKM